MLEEMISRITTEKFEQYSMKWFKVKLAKQCTHSIFNGKNSKTFETVL